MERRKLITATDPKYCGTLLSSLNEQRVQGIFCDVTVIVEDKKFRAHKNILSAASTYFHQQFSVTCQVVELSFVRAEIFSEILGYIYSSKIVRIRSDLLEEVVRSGKLLGVQFLADLGAPLSQVKSMASFIKDHSVEFSPYETDEKVTGNKKPTTTNSVPDKDIHVDVMPVVPGAILSNKEPKETEKLADSKDEGKDDGDDYDDDIIFSSELVAPKPPVLNTEMAQQTTRLHPVALPKQQTSANSNTSAPSQTEPTSKENTPSYIICSQLVPPKPCGLNTTPKPCVLNNTAVMTETTISNAVQLPKPRTSPSSSTNPQTLLIPNPTPPPFSPSEGDGPSQPNLSVDLSSQIHQQASVEKLGSIQSIFTDSAIPLMLKNTIAPQKPISDTVQFLKQKVNASNSTSAQTTFIAKLTSPHISPSSGDKPSQPNVSVTFSPREAQGSVATLGSSQNVVIPNTVLLNQPLLNCSNITTFPQQLISPTINLVVQQVSSVNTLDNSPVAINNTCWPSNPYTVTSALNIPVNTLKEASYNGPKAQGPHVATFTQSSPAIITNSSHPSSIYPLASSFSHQGNRVKEASIDGQKVHKPQLATFTQENICKSGELKIKVAAINSGSNKDSGSTGVGFQHIMDGKKIITLDTPSDLGGLSNDCKVYANIGEDTYDIVIPIKEELDEDEAVDLLRSIDSPPDGKRMKVKHEDHYELTIEGKVYYICIVCKRSYVCLRGLKRHFNCHSWEKKYHCRYCEKVFPLAEYRTKHEIRHTGMKRYQCLTCGNYFIDYKVIISHMKSAHSHDPSKDPRLYLLHPAKPSQIKQEPDTINAHPSTSGPIVSDDIVCNAEIVKEKTVGQAAESGSPSKPMSWDDVFTPQAELDGFKQNASDGTTEFEFIVPESY